MFMMAFASNQSIFWRSKGMKYSNANSVLPEEIVEIIQQYISGEYLYIPRKSGEEKNWGEKNGSRDKLKFRNAEIYSKYKNGTGVLELAQEYYLSDKSIRRIIGEQKKLCSKLIQNHK
jgi:Mor family transcriptional regulator